MSLGLANLIMNKYGRALGRGYKYKSKVHID